MGLFLVLLAAVCVTDSLGYTIQQRTRDTLNNRPIIAVLAQENPTDANTSYIAASYVKYLESAGARILPIPANYSDDLVKEFFGYVNGVLYPGGGAHMLTSGYYKNAKLFHDLAVQANRDGDHFPVWGTCLGFETLNVITVNDDGILAQVSADDVSIPLNYTTDALNSRLLSGLTMPLYKALGSEDISYNHHSKGVLPETYYTQSKLSDFYKILSTNYDLVGKEFVSTIEAYDYPFYGTQWHPEKNNFEFSSEEKFPHSKNAVLISEYFANFFVNEARQNQHKFPSEDMEKKYLIYNYEPQYTGGQPGRLTHFEQIYVFPGASK